MAEQRHRHGHVRVLRKVLAEALEFLARLFVVAVVNQQPRVVETHVLGLRILVEIVLPVGERLGIGAALQGLAPDQCREFPVGPQGRGFLGLLHREIVVVRAQRCLGNSDMCLSKGRVGRGQILHQLERRLLVVHTGQECSELEKRLPDILLFFLEQPLEQRLRFVELVRIDQQRGHRLLSPHRFGIGGKPDLRGLEGLVLGACEECDLRCALGDTRIARLPRHLDVGLGRDVQPTALARDLAHEEPIQDVGAQLLIGEGWLARLLGQLGCGDRRLGLGRFGRLLGCLCTGTQKHRKERQGHGWDSAHQEQTRKRDARLERCRRAEVLRIENHPRAARLCEAFHIRYI